ncbi:MAG: STAS/SEC14 domain-containing protein [Nitriliruptoraceae bacterium]
MPVPNPRASFTLDEDDGLVRIVWGGAVVTSADAEAAVTAVGHRIAGGTHGLLVDMRAAGPIERDARQILAAASGPSRVALLVESARSRVVANFFLGLHRTEVPLQLFDDEDLARSWLQAPQPLA